MIAGTRLACIGLKVDEGSGNELLMDACDIPASTWRPALGGGEGVSA